MHRFDDPAASSTNLLADRRFAYAEALMADGDAVGAADLLNQVLDLVPHWAPAWLALALAGERAGSADYLTAVRKAVALDRDGTLGAGLHLARMSGEAAAALPSAYVRTLFDQYADRFETHLCGPLNYRGPAVMLAALLRYRPWSTGGTALDLGCGTGLMARALAGRVATIDGVDLSARMIAKARATTLYRTLQTGDIIDQLEETADASFDLVLAADVFVYLGELEAVIAHSIRVLRPGGLLAFTVEASQDGEYILGDDMRFRHSENYVRRVLADAGASRIAIDPDPVRRQGGADTPGFVVVTGGRS